MPVIPICTIDPDKDPDGVPMLFRGDEINSADCHLGPYAFTARAYLVQDKDRWPVSEEQPECIQIIIAGITVHYARTFGYSDDGTYMEDWEKLLAIMKAWEKEILPEGQIIECIESNLSGNRRWPLVA